jgi:hypothetical protein
MMGAFLSYAHEDDRGLYSGWVEEFAEHLDQALRGRMRTRASILRRDATDITGSRQLRPQIRGLLDQARALVCLLSGHYLSSGWCPAEVSYWAERDRGEAAGLFRVEIHPGILAESLPPELSNRLSREFYDSAGVRLRARLPETAYAYEQRIARLAVEIANELQQPRALTATVWVAPTGEGAASLAHSLAANLRSRGYSTLASVGAPPPLGTARVAVFVVDGGAASEDSQVRALMDDARARADQGDMTTIVWLPPSVSESAFLPDWVSEHLLDAGPLIIEYANQITLEHMIAEQVERPPARRTCDGQAPVLLVEERGVSSEQSDELAAALQAATGPVQRLRLEGNRTGRAAVQAGANGARAVVLAVADRTKARPVATVLNQWLARITRAPSDRWLWHADDAAREPPPVVAPWRGVAGPARLVAHELLLGQANLS